MKIVPSLFLLLAGAATIAAGADEQTAAVEIKPAAPRHGSNPADEATFRRIIEQWKDGYNNGEAAKVAALYAEDAYYLTQHFVTGVVHGRAAIQAYVQLGVAARYHVDSIKIISVNCSDDMAYAITRYDATNGPAKVFGVNVVVVKKIGGKWLIVAHEAAVPDPATAIQRLDTAATH